MAKKTYRTYYLKGLQLQLKDENGKRIEVIFRGGLQIDSTSRFSTADEELQKMIESCNGFNRDYYLESVSESKPVGKPAEEERKPKAADKSSLTDVKDIKRFRNLVEMRSHMEEIGIAGAKDMNYLQAKAAAAKEGYDFQISKAQ